MSGLTYGHILYAFAAIEIVVGPLLVLNLMRSNPDVPAQSFYIVIAAAILTALALAGVGAFTEFGATPIS